MSVRDEMADLLRSLPVDALPCQQADALLPIVERVVREAAWEGANEHATNGRTTMSAIDAIVARVMESE